MESLPEESQQNKTPVLFVCLYGNRKAHNLEWSTSSPVFEVRKRKALIIYRLKRARE